jgi:hypothetical protein
MCKSVVIASPTTQGQTYCEYNLQAIQVNVILYLILESLYPVHI